MKFVIDPYDENAEVLYVQVPRESPGNKAESYIDTINMDISYVKKCKQAVVFV
jgi:hypothetical protein